MRNNVVLIYEYTETILQDFYKSIDNAASKLVAVMGFSGVLLKFAADMPSEGIGFSIRLLTLLCLMMSVAVCGAGLSPRPRGPSRLAPHYLLEEEYTTSDETIRKHIIGRIRDNIPELRDVQNVRVTCLKAGIGLIIMASILSTLGAIVSSISISGHIYTIESEHEGSLVVLEGTTGKLWRFDLINNEATSLGLKASEYSHYR